MPQVMVGGRQQTLSPCPTCLELLQLGQETKIRQFFSERNLSAELFNKVQALPKFFYVQGCCPEFS